MASFSLKQEKDSKSRSLNSPVFLKKYVRSRKLRAEALGWDEWRKNLFEYNQSFSCNVKLESLEGIENMEAVGEIGGGCNMTGFESERNSKLSQIQLPGKTCEPCILSDSLITLNIINSVGSESMPYVNSGRAIFTIHLPSFQILVVNSAACQLVNYSSDELCSITLESVIMESDKHKLSNLYEKFLKSSGEPNGKLLELVKKDGESISVFIYLKKLENPEKGLVIVEPIDVRTGVIVVDENGKILCCDEDIALIFQYEASECVGLNIKILLPEIDLSKRHEDKWQEIKRQQITGRTKNGYIFSVSLAINCVTPNLEYKIVISVYPSLNGLILLNKRLIITNCNSYFVKLLFGFSKKEIVNKPIVSLIPTFCKDVELEKSKKCQHVSKINDSSLNYLYGADDFDETWNESSMVEECLSALKNRCSLSFNATDIKQCETSIGSCQVDCEGDHNMKSLLSKNLPTDSGAEEEKNNDVRNLLQNGPFTEEDANSDNQRTKKMGKNEIDIYNSDVENYQSIMVQEGKFLGFAKHSDGSYIDVKYQVKAATANEETFYCVWLSRDLFQFLDLNKGSNSVMLSSFNSTSVGSSLPKDSTCSGQYTKPSTASLISQCDENLTAGDYSQYYTNFRHIGKGAFGYVKMAFRNSDGLLVVTKFIKKRSINVMSWVLHSNLNMKIPLEISLLTTLYHPNIVKVLDVFHNDLFVQLVMEKHGAGFDLFEFINRGPKCDEKLKSYIFRQIISAVHYLDSLGILHRDIKDENVIINEKFEVKLIDFGSATFMPPNETFSKFYGTVEYCSPEVLLGNSYKGPELEIWALGVTLYVLTFGENPFCNIEEIIKAQFSLPLPITKELDDLLHRMLEKNVENRITISEVTQHFWINQPVSIENYRFKDVVKCSDEEAYPPKYVHEINSDELYAKDSRTYSNQLGETNNSNSSLQNLSEIDDLDDNFQATQKSITEFVGSKSNGPSTLLSSTPLQIKNERLCKSATAIRNPLQSSLPLSEGSFECHDRYFMDSDLKNNYLKPFKNSSLSDNESDAAKEEVSDFSNGLESEIEMHLKSCRLLEEEYLKANNLSEGELLQNVKEVYGEKGRGGFLGAEDDPDNKYFNPN